MVVLKVDQLVVIVPPTVLIRAMVPMVMRAIRTEYSTMVAPRLSRWRRALTDLIMDIENTPYATLTATNRSPTVSTKPDLPSIF